MNATINYWAEFLLQNRESPDAREDPQGSGWYRHKKIMVGSNKLSIASEIKKFGGIPLSVVPIRKRLPFFDWKVSREYKQEFLLAISYNMGSGLSAGKALQLASENESGAMRERLDLGLRVLQRGGSFSEALRVVGFFDESTLSILDAGERTGTIRQSIESAIEHYGAWASGLKTVLAMGSVVAFEAFSAITSVMGVKYQMLPMIAKDGIKSTDQAKVAAFNTGLKLAEMINDTLFWGFIAVSVLAVGAIVLYFGDEEAPRAWLDKQMGRIPYLKDALLHSALAASSKVVASLLKGGVTFLSAIDTASQGVRQYDVGTYWKTVGNRVRSGDSIAMAMSASLLQNSERVSVMAHTNQNQLGDILGRIAGRRSELAQKATKKFGWLTAGFSFIYILISMAGLIYIGYLQNSAMMAGLG